MMIMMMMMMMMMTTVTMRMRMVMLTLHRPFSEIKKTVGLGVCVTFSEEPSLFTNHVDPHVLHEKTQTGVQDGSTGAST